MNRYVEFIIPGEHGKKVCLRSPFFNTFYINFFLTGQTSLTYSILMDSLKYTNGINGGVI